MVQLRLAFASVDAFAFAGKQLKDGRTLLDYIFLLAPLGSMVSCGVLAGMVILSVVFVQCDKDGHLFVWNGGRTRPDFNTQKETTPRMVLWLYGNVQTFVKTPSGKSFAFDVEAFDNFAQVNAKIQDKTIDKVL